MERLPRPAKKAVEHKHMWRVKMARRAIRYRHLPFMTTEYIELVCICGKTLYVEPWIFTNTTLPIKYPANL